MSKNNTFKLLPETELEHAALSLVGDSRGGYYTGLYVLILEHIGSLVAEQRFADVETAINKVTATMIREEGPRQWAQEEGEKLRGNTRRSLTESLAELGADQKNSTGNPQASNVSTSRDERKRLADAIVEIVTNKTTPTELYNPVVDFVCTAAEGLFHKMQKDPAFIEQALERTTPR